MSEVIAFTYPMTGWPASWPHTATWTLSPLLEIWILKSRTFFNQYFESAVSASLTRQKGSRAVGPLTLPLVDATIERSFAMVMASRKSRGCIRSRSLLKIPFSQRVNSVNHMLRRSVIVGGFRTIRLALTFMGSKPDTHLEATDLFGFTCQERLA